MRDCARKSVCVHEEERVCVCVTVLIANIAPSLSVKYVVSAPQSTPSFSSSSFLPRQRLRREGCGECHCGGPSPPHARQIRFSLLS